MSGHEEWTLDDDNRIQRSLGPFDAAECARQIGLIDLEATRRIIAQQNARFTQAHLTGDVALIDSMFTPDAKSYPPGAAVARPPVVRALSDFPSSCPARGRAAGCGA